MNRNERIRVETNDGSPPPSRTITPEMLQAWRQFRKDSDEEIRRLDRELDELMRKYGAEEQWEALMARSRHIKKPF